MEATAACNAFPLAGLKSSWYTFDGRCDVFDMIGRPKMVAKLMLTECAMEVLLM
jgi:hypothetical protein